MAVVKGDMVIWRERKSKVLVVGESELVLHVGEGQIVREVGERDYTVLPEPLTPLPTKKPKPKSSAKAPIAKARRKVSTGKGKK